MSTRVFVTPHAAEMYIVRVCEVLTPAQAEAEIAEALRQSLFHCPSANGELTLWGCVNRAGYPFLAATDPADESAPFLLVRTVGARYYWHEARHYWRAFNVGSKRRFRLAD